MIADPNLRGIALMVMAMGAFALADTLVKVSASTLSPAQVLFFLIGGALGNVIDRLVYGAVADFLNVTCCGFVNPYAFNVADIAIFVGAIGLALIPEQKAKPKPRQK